MSSFEPLGPHEIALPGRESLAPPLPPSLHQPGQPREPARYFAYASPPAQISTAQILALHREHGAGLLVGFDSNTLGYDLASNRLTGGGSTWAAYAAAKELGAQLHFYSEGPGDPNFSRDERQRVDVMARSIGLPGANAEWFASGWKRYVRAQLQEAFRNGFSTAEIDNLSKATGIRDEGPRLLDFYRNDYLAWWRAGDVPRALLKNHDLDASRLVVEAIERGELPRSMFADFAIVEEHLNARRINDVTGRGGIQTVQSHNTYAYQAAGRFEHDTAYSQIMAGEPQQRWERTLARIPELRLAAAGREILNRPMTVEPLRVSDDPASDPRCKWALT